jgi:undecaprenyl-diphosphatase
MQNLWQRSKKLWHAETWLLVSALAIAGLVLTFGLIAEEVMEGSTSAFDRYLLLSVRSAGNPSDLIGLPWVQEMARDIGAR